MRAGRFYSYSGRLHKRQSRYDCGRRSHMRSRDCRLAADSRLCKPVYVNPSTPLEKKGHLVMSKRNKRNRQEEEAQDVQKTKYEPGKFNFSKRILRSLSESTSQISLFNPLKAADSGVICDFHGGNTPAVEGRLTVSGDVFHLCDTCKNRFYPPKTKVDIAIDKINNTLRPPAKFGAPVLPVGFERDNTLSRAA